MDPSRHYSSIIHSPSFTFLVGPRHTKLTIQSGLAQHVSKPLHNLMNNGHTRESRHRIAVLEDEDVETFVAFCEYAYTGDYNVPRPPIPREEGPVQLGVVEGAASPESPWRETYRSNSMSSAIPPQAPSPPPESVRSVTQTVKLQSEHEPEPDPTPVIEEETAVEAAAVEQADASKEEATQPEEQTIDEPKEAVLPPTEDGRADENPELAVEGDEWGSLGASPSKKSKKSKKKKKQQPQQHIIEEPPANLTPPSTPPPEAPTESDDIPTENAPEELREEQVEAPQTEALEGDPDAAYESAVEPVPEPVPEAEPEPEPEPAPETWDQSPAHSLNDDASPLHPEEQPEKNEWTDDAVEGQGADEHTELPPKPFIDMSFAKQSDSLPRTPGLSLWAEFTALQYNDEEPPNLTPPIVENSNPDLPYLTFHAKVYVFATRYLIPALAQLCLRKLHGDLMHLSFGGTDDTDTTTDLSNLSGLAARQAPMVLDLLRYAYTKTTRLEPISPTSATQLRENELRRLVVHYAACKVKELARYHSLSDSGTTTPSVRRGDIKLERAEEAYPKSLRSLLDLTPELASDLVYRMM